MVEGERCTWEGLTLRGNKVAAREGNLPAEGAPCSAQCVNAWEMSHKMWISSFFLKS